MSDRPDLDKAIQILQDGGIKITGGKYAPQTPKKQSNCCINNKVGQGHGYFCPKKELT